MATPGLDHVAGRFQCRHQRDSLDAAATAFTETILRNTYNESGTVIVTRNS